MNNDTGTPPSGTAHAPSHAQHFAADNPHPQMPAKRSSARRTCVFCLGSVIVVILGLALFFGATFLLSGPSRKEAISLIESEIVPALKTLDSAKLQSIGTAELQDSLQTTAGLNLITSVNEKLGPVQSVEMSQAQWRVHYGSSGRIFQWSSPTVFQKESTGTLSLVLKRIGGNWKLHGFNINSPDLI